VNEVWFATASFAIAIYILSVASINFAKAIVEIKKANHKG
jgi:hypothetical protein